MRETKHMTKLVLNNIISNEFWLCENKEENRYKEALSLCAHACPLKQRRNHLEPSNQCLIAIQSHFSMAEICTKTSFYLRGLLALPTFKVKISLLFYDYKNNICILFHQYIIYATLKSVQNINYKHSKFYHP